METKNTNNPNVKKEKRNFVADHVAEFKKIIWPTKNDVAKKTATVIVTSIFIGAVIFCMDTVFSQLQNIIISVLG